MIKTEKALKILGGVSVEKNGNLFTIINQDGYCFITVDYKPWNTWEYLTSIKTLKDLKKWFE